MIQVRWQRFRVAAPPRPRPAPPSLNRLSLPGTALRLLPIRFPGTIPQTPPHRAAPTDPSFWEFAASPVELMGMRIALFPLM